MSVKTARVVIDGTVLGYDKCYDYIVPQEFNSANLAGCRVLVPFGRANNVRQATVIAHGCADATDKLKEIKAVVDTKPVLNAEMLELCEFLRERTFCTYYDAIRTLLPFGLDLKLVKEYTLCDGFSGELDDDMRNIAAYIKKNGSVKRDKLLQICALIRDSDLPERLEQLGFLKSESNAVRRIGDASVKMARLCEDMSGTVKLTQKQQEVADLLCEIGNAPVKEICYYTGVTVAVVKALESKGVIELYDQEVLRPAYSGGKTADVKPITLSESQQKTYDTLNGLLCSGKSATALLYGVTGSGKTQVYLKLCDRMIEQGKGVIVMVPEIALTPQTLNLFNNRYGGKIAVFHSAMAPGQRMDEYKRVKNGEALVAIGTRSAVFAPFENLGLIIMDEEQEHTYKSEMSPRFHARDVARFRAAKHNCLLLLASATPAVESYAAAKEGKFELCKLDSRYGSAQLPEVVTVDMKNEVLSGNNGAISSVLAQKMQETLDNGNQCVVLLNRRGHNTYVSCPSCGMIETCPNCSISMTYHSANGRMMCHYCGYSHKTDGNCSVCGSKLRFFGVGTQRVEEELQALFPKAKILRMDADSVTTKNAYAQKLGAFAKGEYDILLGTQMVAKGLDFPKVTLVGVLGADRAGYSEDFRSFERTFSLLTQVVGRSGRGEQPGVAVIQTFNPTDHIIKLAAQQDYDAFFDEEILTRKLMTYPPYCDIASLNCVCADKGEASNAANELLNIIKEKISGEYSDVKLIILGPVPPAIPKVNNKYRYRLIIKCKANARFRTFLRDVLDESRKNRAFRNTAVYVDVNPANM